MNTLKGAAIIGQSGGPTAVINSSLYGVIKTALESDVITQVLGTINGIKGILEDNIIDLGKEDKEELELLKYSPSAILGSCRYKLEDEKIDDTDYKKILEIFQKYNIRYFFYIGGNDSMDTCNKISKYMEKCNYECRIMGIPKTIDNDLTNTDHCPGYASSAKYIGTVMMEIYRDANVYDRGMITIVEIMGRNAGWLTAATALASLNNEGPDLIFLPECNFDIDEFIKKVSELYKRKNKVLVAISEGIHDKNGKLISEYNFNSSDTDSFGHLQLGGVASYLANVLKKETGSKIRAIELSLLQRCAAHFASLTDIEEAFMAGKTACEEAIKGTSGKMVGFERLEKDKKYVCNPKLVDLELVANTEKKFPKKWINSTEDGVTEEFIKYVLPLIQGETKIKMENGLPRFASLKKIKVIEK